MAKLCSNCGVALERDDARFCQNCGKPTSSHTASSAALPAEEQLEDTLRMPVVKKSRKGLSSLPEQIAQQPMPKPHVPVAEQPALEQETAQPAQSVKTFSVPPPRTEPPAQELHAEEVADQHITEASTPSDAVQDTPVSVASSSLDKLPSTPPSPAPEEPEASDQEPEIRDQQPEASNIEVDAVEDLPTLLLEPDSAEASASDHADSEAIQKDHADDGEEQSAIPAIVRPIPAKFSAFPDAASRFTSPLPSVVLPDRPKPASISSFPAALRRLTSPVPAIVQSIPSKLSALPTAIRDLTSPLPAVAQSIPAWLSALLSAVRDLTSSAPARLRTRHRLPIPVVAAVLVALVLVGVGSWVVFAQPFSVAPVTQPLLGFSDAQLGLSLLYPNGWTSQKDASDSTVQFSDSSHTAQVIIAVYNTNNSTITADLQKQSAQLGMSGAKSVSPLSFAGASWQAMQGSVQQNSASYTCTIFATTHANHLVLWTQLAPQGVYNREESVIFSAMRQSLRFV